MEKNTKILLGVAAAGVVAYLLFKNKKAAVNTTDPYICPQSYTLGTKQLFESEMWVCRDSKGNILNILDEYGNLINGVKANPTYVPKISDDISRLTNIGVDRGMGGVTFGQSTFEQEKMMKDLLENLRNKQYGQTN